MIKGEKIYLTELDRRNAETIRAWLNDPEVHRWLLVGHVPITWEEEEQYFDRQAHAVDSFNFEIHVASDGRYIGNIGLKDVDLRHRHGEVGIVIGDKTAWGQGFGSDAILTCVGFAFSTLGLHKVSIRCHEEHARGLELYLRLGFIESGRERDHVYQEGHFQDEIILDMLDEEYRQLYFSRL
jgi:ribosomal-protein-alanine N-acetyltransferase